MNEDEDADYEDYLDSLAHDDEEDEFNGPTDEFFYADEWELEEHYEPLPFEDECYEMGY